MAAYFELMLSNSAAASPPAYGASWDVVTIARVPRLSELMLFEPGSLVPDDGSYRFELLSERASATARFDRRLGEARSALAWLAEEGRAIEGFGAFMRAVDCAYVRFDMSEPRIYFSAEEEQAFARELAFVLSALDLPSIGIPGELYGGTGRFSAEWERVLAFCGFDVPAVYRGDASVPQPSATGAAHLTDNPYSRLLRTYLPP